MGETFDDLMAHVPVTEAAAADLRARLEGADRHYHGMAHVELLWRRHLRYGAGLPVSAAPWHGWIACAIAFHDAIYDATRADNEQASAALWRAAAPALPSEGIEWVAGTILATSDHLGAAPEPAMPAAAWQARVWMLDLDLTPLGEVRAVFNANTDLLRREFAHLSDAQWEQGRAAFLRKMVGVPRLYRTPVLHDAFEAQARANLAADA